MCASIPFHSQLTSADGQRIKTIAYPGIAVITENFHGGQIVATCLIEPSGKETRYRFNAKGLVLEKIDPDGVQSKKLRNAKNQIIQGTDPLGRVTDSQYDPRWNQPTQITRYLDDGSPVVTQIQYHATNGQPTQLTDPENRRTTLGYTAKGQLQSTTDALGQQTLLSYNAAGDLIETQDALGHLTRMQTDGAGRTTQTTTPKGYDWQQTYNGATQPRIQTAPLNGQIQQVYDAAHRLISIQDPNGHPVERYAYDASGNLTAKTDALNQQETYQYDPANRLIQTTTRKGESIAYAYDSQDRLIQISRPDSTTNYSYDAAGRLIQIQEGATRLQYDYDQADRLTREVQDTPSGFNSIEYQYDTLDRRTSRKVNGADETRYSYNKAGQLTQMQYRGETTAYQYDAAGRLTSKTLPGGIAQTYQYDPANRLTQIQYKNGATLIDQLDLSYDAEGNITKKQLQNGSLNPDTALTATYDAANRMTQVTVSGKTYSLAYDRNGNLTGKTNTADASDSTAYTWDARNRLTAIAASGLSASFRYDPLGRRIERTVNGETTTYLYDGNQAIGEVRAGQTTSLLTGLSIDEAIARYASTGRLTQLTDQLGSVIKQINAAGVVQSTTAYSPYGEATTTGDGQGNSTEYTGRENDGTGLYFYRARYYDRILKRWLSEDPIGTAGGLNLYAYVEGNPLSRTDPLGLFHYNYPSPRTIPTIGPTLTSLECLEQCVRSRTPGNVDLRVSGGEEAKGHSRKSEHPKATACDISGPRWNRGIDNADMFDCAKQCGFGAGQFEGFTRSPENNHWHFQLFPSNGVPAMPGNPSGLPSSPYDMGSPWLKTIPK